MKIAVLAAHTDDAETGCGGVILNAVANGDEVTIVNFTPEQDKEEAFRSAALTGVQRTEFLRFPDRGITTAPVHYQRLKAKLDELQADIILAHWPVDEHPDHRNVGILAQQYVNERQMAYTAPGAAPGTYCPQLLFFEVISGKQTKCFKPECFVELSKECFEKKCRLMKLFTGNPPDIYGAQWYGHHIMMMEFRARESGACRHAEIDAGIWAEAFVRFPGPRNMPTLRLPGER